MTKFIQIQNGNVVRTVDEYDTVEWDAENYCTPAALERDGKSAQFGVFRLVESAAPAFDPITQSATELPPVLVDGNWVQQWEIVELFSTQAEKDAAIAADIEAKRKAAVPASVTRRQAKQALLLNGLLANVQPAIDAIPDATQRAMIQIEWDDSQVFERDRPALIALGSALGLTSVQLDDLFIGAAQL